jgi:hypothetical protein
VLFVFFVANPIPPRSRKTQNLKFVAFLFVLLCYPSQWLFPPFVFFVFFVATPFSLHKIIAPLPKNGTLPPKPPFILTTSH